MSPKKRVDTNSKDFGVRVGKVKNLGKKINILRSGIIPCTKVGNETYLCFGVDSISRELTDFGGGVSSNDQTPITAALRELYEESLGVFSFNDSQSIGEQIFCCSGTMMIIFIHCDVDPEDKKEKFLNKVSKTIDPEVLDIVWLRSQVLVNKVSDTEDKEIYSKVKNLLSLALQANMSLQNSDSMDTGNDSDKFNHSQKICNRCGVPPSEEAIDREAEEDSSARKDFVEIYKKSINIPDFYFYDIAYAIWGENEKKRCEIKDKYFLMTDSQNTNRWAMMRNKRATASNFGSILGNNRFKSCDEWMKNFCGQREETFDSWSKFVMARGQEDEPIVRKWLENKLNENDKEDVYEIREVGLAIPKSDIRLGASSDGVIYKNGKETNEIVEIKCTRKFSVGMQDYFRILINGRTPDKNWKAHIHPQHYDQMQGTMYIMDKKICHYTVYSWYDKHVVSIPVEFDRSYWNFMEKSINKSLETAIPQLLRNKKNELNRKRLEADLFYELVKEQEELIESSE